MSFDTHDPSAVNGEQPRDRPARAPDGLIVPANTVSAPRPRPDLDEDFEGVDGTPVTPTEGLDIASINFAEMDLFASTGTTKLNVPNSEFHILVKNELDFGEQATLDSISIRGIQRTDVDGMDSNSMVVLDVAKQRLYSLAMYVVGWNFATLKRDGSREPVRLPRTLEERVRMFRRMSPIVGQALTEMIQKHIDQHNQEIKRVESAEEHRLGLMSAVEDEQEAPKATTSGAFAT